MWQRNLEPYPKLYKSKNRNIEPWNTEKKEGTENTGEGKGGVNDSHIEIKGQAEMSECPDRQMNLTWFIVIIYSHLIKLLSYQITDLLAVMIK